MGLKMAEPTTAEMEKMKELLEEELKAGAIGLSTGLAYMPGRYSKTEELLHLAGIVKKYGGIYASHIRDQGEKITPLPKLVFKHGDSENAKEFLKINM